MSEAPLVSAPPAAAVRVPGSVVATPEKAGIIVERSLGTTHTSLSGEAQVPSQVLTFPSLPIDAGVSEKLGTKIWNNDFFDFSELLSNPVFEDRYQLTISNSDKDKIPSQRLRST